MRRAIIISVFAFLAAGRLGATEVWFSSAPGSVQSGEGYYVEATAWGDGGCDLSVWKNGGWFAGGSGGWVSAGNWTTDYGAQTVEFWAEAYDWWYGWGAWDWTYVQVNASAPPNNPPNAWVEVDGHGSGATVTRPYGGSVTVTIRYQASDPDGNLARIRPQVWHPGSGLFTNDGGGWTGQSGGSGTVTRSVTLDRDGDWYFWTDAEDTNNVFVNSGAWGDGFRLHVVEASAPNQSPQTHWAGANNVNVGQATTLTGNASDPDGNLQTMHFYVTGPGLPGWNYVGSAGLSGGNATGATNWTPAQPGSYSVHIRAVDTAGAWDWNASITASFTVANPNSAPSITLLSPASQSIAYGATLSISSRATDPDGNLNTHNLDLQRPDGVWNYYSGSGFATGEPFQGGPVGSAADSTRTASFTFNQTGTWQVRSYAHDAGGQGVHSATVAITVGAANSPPVATVVVDGQSHGATVTRPLGGATQITVRYRATDADGNLSGIRPQAWRPDGYLDNNSGAFLAQSGAAGEVVRTVTLDQDGNWYFWTDATDTVISPGYTDSGPWTSGFRLNVVPAQGSDTTPPGIPSVTASLVASESFRATWTNPGDNVGVTGYRWRLDGGAWNETAATSQQFTGLTPGASDSDTALGLAVTDDYFDESEESYTYNAFVAANRNPFTNAHELAHLLTDGGHINTSEHNWSLNLLRGGSGASSNTFEANKRLNAAQESRIHANSRTKNSPP